MRRVVSLLGLLGLPCVPVRGSPIPPLAPVSSRPPAGIATPVPVASPATPLTPRCDPVVCDLVRHRIDSAFARRVGFSRTPDGLVADHGRRWRYRVSADSFRLVEVPAACDALMGYFAHDDTRIWLPESAPGSRDCGVRRCAPDEQGYRLVPFARRVRVIDFRPLGGGLFTDGRRVFFDDEVVDDLPPPDPASFHTCVDSDLPHYVAADRHGPFGNFECGGIIRLRP